MIANSLTAETVWIEQKAFFDVPKFLGFSKKKIADFIKLELIPFCKKPENPKKPEKPENDKNGKKVSRFAKYQNLKGVKLSPKTAKTLNFLREYISKTANEAVFVEAVATARDILEGSKHGQMIITAMIEVWERFELIAKAKTLRELFVYIGIAKRVKPSESPFRMQAGEPVNQTKKTDTPTVDGKAKFTSKFVPGEFDKSRISHGLHIPKTPTEPNAYIQKNDDKLSLSFREAFKLFAGKR